MMNNVVMSQNSARAFKDFSQPQNGYYLPAQNEEYKQKSYKRGTTITLSALGIGFGILALTKGSWAKQLTKVLEKWRLKLEAKGANSDEFQSLYHHSIAKAEAYIGKTQSVNNFTSFKDVLFQKLMCGKDGKRSFTAKIHRGITKLFDKLSRATVNKSYASTQRKFAGLSENIADINEQILKQHPEFADRLDLVNKKISLINSNLNKGFGINARNNRMQEMKEATDGLFDYFWNASFGDIKNNYKNKNIYQTFIADNYINPARAKMTAEVSKLRNGISYNITDMRKTITNLLDEIQKDISFKDTEANKVMNLLRKNMEKFEKLSGKNEVVERKALNKEILANLDKLAKNLPEDKHTDLIKNVLKTGNKGKLEEILSIYKEILPRSEYLKLKSQMEKAVKSLDNSIETETVKYFDKYRDLKLGSAPTDILSILGTVGTMGWFLSKAKDKDERISLALKYGIPAVGTIATSLYGTARLISGGKSLAFGLVSGWVIGKLGAMVDDMRKKYSLDVAFEKRSIEKLQPDKV